MEKGKKILAIILSMTICLTMAACAGGGSKPSDSNTGTTTSPAQTSENGSAASDLDFGDYSADNPLKIKLSHFVATETNQIHLLAAAFKEKVEAASGGAVEVTIYSGGVLGNDRESFESVVAGTLEMAVNNTPIVSNYNNIYQVLDLPYLFKDYDHIYSFLNSDVCQELMDALTETGTRYLCLQAVGYRNFDMVTGPVTTPADIAGLKIRVTDSPIYVAQYEAWKANPIIISGTEVLTALQQGTIDGTDNVNNVQYADGYYEFAKYITISEHAVHFNGLTINDKLYQSLTEDLQGVISTAAQEAASERTKALEKENEEQLDIMGAAGATIYRDIDKQSFIDAAQGVYDNFLASHKAASYVERIQALSD